MARIDSPSIYAFNWIEGLEVSVFPLWMAELNSSVLVDQKPGKLAPTK
jgi:hypothetical protein